MSSRFFFVYWLAVQLLAAGWIADNRVIANESVRMGMAGGYAVASLLILCLTKRTLRVWGDKDEILDADDQRKFSWLYWTVPLGIVLCEKLSHNVLPLSLPQILGVSIATAFLWEVLISCGLLSFYPSLFILGIIAGVLPPTHLDFVLLALIFGCTYNIQGKYLLIVVACIGLVDDCLIPKAPPELGYPLLGGMIMVSAVIGFAISKIPLFIARVRERRCEKEAAERKARAEREEAERKAREEAIEQERKHREEEAAQERKARAEREEAERKSQAYQKTCQQYRNAVTNALQVIESIEQVDWDRLKQKVEAVLKDDIVQQNRQGN